jgi:hypothetical protein
MPRRRLVRFSMSSDAKTTWIVQQVGVSPRNFLAADGTWGGAARAQQFETEAEAWLTVCPGESTGVAMRVTHHQRRMGEDLPAVVVPAT